MCAYSCNNSVLFLVSLSCSLLKRSNKHHRLNIKTQRHHVKLIWLYCSHCAYCRCFVVTATPCGCAATLPTNSPRPHQDDMCCVLNNLTRYLRSTQQQAHTLLSSSCKPPSVPAWPPGCYCLCGGDVVYYRVLDMHGDIRRD